jgi:lysophospholipase L1-like esterase
MRRSLRSQLTYANETVTRTGLRRTATALITFLAALALWAAPASAVAPPKVMAGLGDSITRAFNSDDSCSLFRDCPVNSFSTGTNEAVNSQFQRIKAIDPERNPVANNDAVSGARASGLDDQAKKAASQDADYVTIEIGANDACRSDPNAQMTPTGTFRSQVKTALDDLVAADPMVYIEMLSIPDINRLHTIFTDPVNQAALDRWSALHVCQNLLVRPLSTDQADVDRRAAFRAQVVAYNGALADVCAEIKRCLYDKDAVFKRPFTTADVSTADYFHPSLQGQTRLAEVSWEATFSME